MARKKKSLPGEGQGVVEQLREAIRRSGRTLQNLAAESGVGKDRLSRFMRGERDLTFNAVERVCYALGLRLAGGDGASASARPESARPAKPPQAAPEARTPAQPANEPSGQKKPAVAGPARPRGKQKDKGE